MRNININRGVDLTPNNSIYDQMSWANRRHYEKMWEANYGTPANYQISKTNPLYNPQSEIGELSDFNTGGYVKGVVTNIAGDLSEAYRMSIAPDLSRGHFFAGSDDFAQGRMRFYSGRLSITNDYARTIDDFFNRFGYATKKLKRPNTHSRPHWNYIKTIGCTIKGNVPSDDKAEIESIYNKGITFWKHGNEVGNYSLDNSPQ